MSAPATIRHTVLSKEATNPAYATNPDPDKDTPRTHTPPKGDDRQTPVSAKRGPHGNVTVSWEPPASGGNIPISQYYIAVSTDEINWTQLNLGTRKTDPEYIHEASDVPKTGEGERLSIASPRRMRNSLAWQVRAVIENMSQVRLSPKNRAASLTSERWRERTRLN